MREAGFEPKNLNPEWNPTQVQMLDKILLHIWKNPEIAFNRDTSFWISAHTDFMGTMNTEAINERIEKILEANK